MSITNTTPALQEFPGSLMQGLLKKAQLTRLQTQVQISKAQTSVPSVHSCKGNSTFFCPWQHHHHNTQQQTSVVDM